MRNGVAIGRGGARRGAKVWARAVSALAVLALLAAACGDDRDDDGAAQTTTTAGGAESSTTSAGGDGGEDGSTTTAAEGSGETFGDMEWPCGPGDGEGNTASDTGVTEDSIVIGTGDDRGFASSPGLNQEIGDAIEAMVEKCNELGGINGRTIELNFYDGKILDIVNAMTNACADGNFMLVGQGFAGDASQEEVRLGCELPSVPAYSVSASFAHGPLMIQPVPNPADEYHTGIAEMLAELYPDRIQNAGVLFANYAATIETKDKVLLSYPEHGWNFTTSLEYNIGGEDDWTPFVLQLRDAGVQILYFSGSCLPNFQAFMQAAAVNDLDIVVALEANFYDTPCVQANSDGAMDNAYVKLVFGPFEEADVNQATQDYIDVVTASGGGTSLLGMQATSSFLLWASAVRDCGADLTRDCVMEGIGTYSDWTAGGLHAPGDPAGNHPVECGVLMKFSGTTYERVSPEEPGTFDCESGDTIPTPTDAAQAAMLDENRVSQQFAPA